jgi:hypothetical protein
MAYSLTQGGLPLMLDLARAGMRPALPYEDKAG